MTVYVHRLASSHLIPINFPGTAIFARFTKKESEHHPACSCFCISTSAQIHISATHLNIPIILLVVCGVLNPSTAQDVRSDCFCAGQHCLYQVCPSPHLFLFITTFLRLSSPTWSSTSHHRHMVTCSSLTSIRYWGKRDTNLILPTNSSLSVTLDQDHLRSTTTSRADSSFSGGDRLWLNGKEEVIKENGRMWVCLKELKACRKEIEDENESLPKVSITHLTF